MLSLAYSQKRTPAISDGRYGEAPNKLEPTAHSGQSLMCIFRAARQVLRSLAIHSGAKSGYRLMMLRLRLLQATLPNRLAVRCSLPRELTFVEASKSWVGGISRWAERRLLVNCFLAPIILRMGSQLFWEIRGCNSTECIFEKRVPLHQYTEDQVRHF
jgi:hypothetical protein